MNNTNFHQSLMHVSVISADQIYQLGPEPNLFQIIASRSTTTIGTANLEIREINS